jgi:ribosomal protein L28
MSDTVSQPAIQSVEADEKLVRRWLSDIQRMNDQIQSDQERIVRLKIETDALRGDTQRLKAEARAALARMGETI